MMRHHLEKHADLYHTNAYFKNAVDALIPILLDGLAAQARTFGAEHDKLLQRIMYADITSTMCPHYWEPMDGDPDPQGMSVDVECRTCRERRRMTIDEYWSYPAVLEP